MNISSCQMHHSIGHHFIVLSLQKLDKSKIKNKLLMLLPAATLRSMLMVYRCTLQANTL